MSENPTPVPVRRMGSRLPISVPGAPKTRDEIVSDPAAEVQGPAGSSDVAIDKVVDVRPDHPMDHPMEHRRPPIERHGAKSPETDPLASRELPAPPMQPFYKVAAFGFLGALFFAGSLSPFGFGQLGFLAVAPWAWLVLDARRISWAGYLSLLASGIFAWSWLFILEIDLGNGTLISNFPMITYLGLYVPAFVWLGRLARSLWRIPTYLLLPVIWCGLEWVRCNLFGGFSLGLLAHSVADSRRVLQMTDLIGSYGLGMLMVASGSSVAELLWIARRIRHLEGNLPRGDEEPKPGSSVFTAANQFISGRFSGDANKAETRASASLIEAVRRNRDHARDVHLISVAFSVIVIVGVLVFANSYGRARVSETRTWKLFETNLFGVTVLGGKGAEEEFQREARRDIKALLVGAFDTPVETSGQNRPTLKLVPVDGSDGAWRCSLSRVDFASNSDPSRHRILKVPAGEETVPAGEEPSDSEVKGPRVNELSDDRPADDSVPEKSESANTKETLATSAAASSPPPADADSTETSTETIDQTQDLLIDPSYAWKQMLGSKGLPSCRFKADADTMPLTILATVSATTNIEYATNQCLRAEPQRGKGIDVTVVAIQPGSFDGSDWPRLMTRSVIAAAVANRCPIIACVPGRMAAVANGDGDLWWSSALQPSSDGDPNAQGQSTNEPIRVQAMIDPRVSYYVASAGSLPAMVCALLTIGLPVTAVSRRVPFVRRMADRLSRITPRRKKQA